MTTRRLAVTALLLSALAGACGSEAPTNPETIARDEFIRALAEREGLGDVWFLTARADLVFEDGFSMTELVDPRPRHRWHEISLVNRSERQSAVRWIGPSAHLRVRGRGRGRDMHLRIWGRTEPLVLFTHPRVTATFDGLEFYSEVVDDTGEFFIQAVIPGDWMDGWSDVYVTLSSVSEPWREPASLRIARIEGVVWEPVR